MQIFVFFTFNGETEPSAITAIEGDITDMLLPLVGDMVKHRDTDGVIFEGEVTERQFVYDVKKGHAIDGAVAVTICLKRISRT